MLVLAKTTGSKPCLIFPDGKEIEIHRRGLPTILEGKRVLKEAARTDVHAIVLEMMSIRPESLFTEAFRMMKPHILVITNVREDHVDEIGKSKQEIASCFASAIPENAAVIVPEEEYHPEFQRKADKVGAKLLLVPPGLSQNIPASRFEQNFRLALAVVEFLGKDRDKAFLAAAQAAPDFGGLKVWEVKEDSSVAGWYFVSAFAANDPETTNSVLARLREEGLFEGKKSIGLLNLRKDRGDRTMQWFDALQEKDAFAFDRLVFVGEHALALKTKLQRRIKPEIAVFKGKNPEEVIAKITALEKEKAVVFGMGNMGGIGRSLVDYWEMVGARHDV
jgi:poly-gamma-glutamate synthase PgsB/CapB